MKNIREENVCSILFFVNRIHFTRSILIKKKNNNKKKKTFPVDR